MNAWSYAERFSIWDASLAVKRDVGAGKICAPISTTKHMEHEPRDEL
jgi:hypothetical protein